MRLCLSLRALFHNGKYCNPRCASAPRVNEICAPTHFWNLFAGKYNITPWDTRQVGCVSKIYNMSLAGPIHFSLMKFCVALLDFIQCISARTVIEKRNQPTTPNRLRIGVQAYLVRSVGDPVSFTPPEAIYSNKGIACTSKFSLSSLSGDPPAARKPSTRLLPPCACALCWKRARYSASCRVQ